MIYASRGELIPRLLWHWIRTIFLNYGELMTKFLTFAVKVEFLIRNSSNISNVRSWP